MELSGFVLYTVTNKDTLVDLRLGFTAAQGKDIAIYWFDKNSSQTDQTTADVSVRLKAHGKKPRQPVKIIGDRAEDMNDQRMKEGFDKLAKSGSGEKAKITILKPSKDAFTVKIEKLGGSGSDLMVPFSGDPDDLAGQHFPGMLMMFASSKEKDIDIAGLIEKLMP